MLKTTRNKEEKQAEPSKTLVPIIKNRIKLKDGSAFSRTKPYCADIRP